MSGTGLTVGAAARRRGLAGSALRLDDAQGVTASARTAGDQRRHRRDGLRRLGVIRVGQRVGIPLAEVRAALVGLPEDRGPTAAEWERVPADWRDPLTARIAPLTALRDQLTGCIGCGCLSLARGAPTNPPDRLGQRGAARAVRSRP